MKVLGTSGGVDGLGVMEAADPQPSADEVVVRVHAAAVNSADLKVIQRAGPARFLHAMVDPHVPGYDLSGVVEAVGPDVADLAVGDAVFGHLAYSGKTRQGTFAELVTIGAQHVAKKPASVSHVTAAASATVGLTALQAIRDKAGITGGAPRVLIIGASGGVGSLAVGIAKRLGCDVTAVCSTYAVDFVTELGADTVIDRKNEDPLRNDDSYAAIFDTTGLYGFGACKHSLADDGTLVTTLPSGAFVLGKLQCLFSKRSCELIIVQSRRADLEQLAAWMAEGLVVPIFSEDRVSNGGKALARLAEGGVLGKIAIHVAEGF